MAPRYPSTDFSSLVVDTSLEFKPRLDLWADQSSWRSLEEQSKPKRQRVRTVRFSRSTPKEVEYLHVTDYTKEEKEACFYKRAEYKRMRAHNEQTVDKMVRGEELNASDETSTGMEMRTPYENMVAHQAIRQAVHALLDEQDDQLRYDGQVHEEILAARYMAYTAACKDRAHWLGQVQAKDSLF
jgi:hypothetical protein